jgi:hypothetical protein
VAFVNRPHESRLLAVRTSDQVVWRPSEGRPLRAGDRLIVVATRAGLSRLLAESHTGTDTAPDQPFRLLAPWELPQPRSGVDAPTPATAEGTAVIPPIGPADAGSTRPA